MATVKEQLVAARALIADEKRWTQREFARDETGIPVDPVDDSACAWCALGALSRVLNCSPLGEDWSRVETLASVVTEDGLVVEVNDTDGHAAVLAMFDRAIEAAE